MPFEADEDNHGGQRRVALRSQRENEECEDSRRQRLSASTQHRPLQNLSTNATPAPFPTPRPTAPGFENQTPASQPNARSLAQRRRRERERQEREQRSTTTQGPLNYQSLEQQQQPQPREQDSRMRHPPTPQSTPQPPALSNRALAQQRRRERERQLRQHSHAPYPTPPLTQHQPTIPDPPEEDENASHHNNRSEAQRRRRQRERENGLIGHGSRSRRNVAGAVSQARDVILEDALFKAARRPYRDPPMRHDLGRMNIECRHCRALHWIDERLAQSSVTSPRFSTCCDQGQVQIPLLEDPPEPLRNLLLSNSEEASVFRKNLWKYNRAFAFTSLGVFEDFAINNGTSAPVFRICGDLHHYSGALTPADGTTPRYAQLYMYEPQAALAHRASLNEDLDREIMQSLQTMITESNPLARLYRSSYETMSREPTIADLQVRLRLLPGQDRRRYNTPTSDEFAIILPGNESSYQHGRDIVLRFKGQGLQRISDLHAAYAPLQYPLLFPYGEPGWSDDLKLRSKEDLNLESSRRLSQTRFAAFRLQHRPNEAETLLRGGRLLTRYTVDMWASADQNRLRFIREHQPQIRAELYSGLEDALSADDEGNTDPSQLGRPIVLPSSYIGGPRNMMQRYQDAMAIARHHRKVDLFVTMTCNPKWPEIERELLPGQTAFDRPDLVARVFELKKRALVDDIYKHGIFGKAVAYVYVIEFQKRGLPHMHLLVCFEQPYKLTSIEAIDSCIRAYWPDPITEPLLFETVKNCMVHGPCGPLNPNAPCMENGKCTKGFPKPFCNETSFDENKFPTYQRKNNGRQYKVGHYMVDNRWIVAYSPYLSGKYNCHINVECVASLGSIGYVVKYMEKGPDRATLELMRQRYGREIQINERDEIQKWIMGRYLSAPESLWRIYHFGIHKQSPSVETLQVHLPGQHLVAFDPNEDPTIILQRASQERTKLTGFFRANADPELRDTARHYTYQEFPQHFVYDNHRRAWKIRQGPESLGRMVFVPPNAGERFYLRTLLSVVKGATSFEDLRTYNGVVHPTFRDACLAQGLLEDDGEWRQCMQEAGEMGTGGRLRHLYVTILLFCNPSQPEVLWNEFRSHMCDNLHYRLSSRYGILNATQEQVYDYGLYLINEMLLNGGRSLNDLPSMPKPMHDWSQLQDNPLITEQLNYNQDAERQDWETRHRLLNTQQRAAYDQIMQSVEDDSGALFFLHGSGGTGKTFVYKTVCNKVRSDGWIILCVASSGIAALLLPGGRTSHSMFSIPVGTLAEDSTCNIAKQSPRAELLRRTRAVIWDEAVPQHRFAFEALDRTCRDIRDDDRPFGGITVIFGGDFQQTLPVVKRGSREDIVGATIRESYLWNHVTILQLTQNMRLDADDPSSSTFAQWLVDVGHGRNLQDDRYLPLPEGMQCQDTHSLINFIYPDINSAVPPPPDYFLNRMILAPRNSDVADVNNIILDRLSGEKHTYISADKILSEDSHIPLASPSHPIPVEFLRSINASGLPPGELSLKIGAPLILLRNLAPKHGLCNGTRIILKRMTDRVLEVQIIGGAHDGELAFIPRISLIPSDTSDLTFKFSRRQFPVHLAFALTINKAQGQSVKYVGLDLRTPVFAHGQLYVALSRATSGRRIKVILPEDESECKSLNVVYPEVLID